MEELDFLFYGSQMNLRLNLVSVVGAPYGESTGKDPEAVGGSGPRKGSAKLGSRSVRVGRFWGCRVGVRA